MTVRLAQFEDIQRYASLAVEAQRMLREKGLAQYVPAAHAENVPAIERRIASGSLYAMCLDDSAVAFFSLEEIRSPWWPDDGIRALYLAGMVVSSEFRGQSIGAKIIAWCMAEARRRQCSCLRLDCHAGNSWLCAYYESHGFVLKGRVQQQPSYIGALYQRDV